LKDGKPLDLMGFNRISEIYTDGAMGIPLVIKRGQLMPAGKPLDFGVRIFE